MLCCGVPAFGPPRGPASGEKSRVGVLPSGEAAPPNCTTVLLPCALRKAAREKLILTRAAFCEAERGETEGTRVWSATHVATHVAARVATHVATHVDSSLRGRAPLKGTVHVKYSTARVASAGRASRRVT